MSYFKGFGLSSNGYGSLYFGGNTFPGFLFKKNGGGGGRKNPKYGLICNKPTYLYNTYIPGSGVGASNVSVRRNKLLRATNCRDGGSAGFTGGSCGRFYGELGIQSKVTNN